MKASPAPAAPAAFARHATAAALCEPETRLALTEGRFKVTVADAMAQARHVLKIYQRRAGRLSTHKSVQAQRLTADVAALCASLAEQDSSCLVAISEIQLEGGRLISLVERADTKTLLGCIASVDRREVSEKEWTSLWQDLNGTLPDS